MIEFVKQNSTRVIQNKQEEEHQGPEFALHEFKNLHSLVNAWYYANYKLNITFDSQTKNAMVNIIKLQDQLYGRYVQLIEAKNSCIGLYKRTVTHEHIQALDRSLLMQVI